MTAEEVEGEWTFKVSGCMMLSDGSFLCEPGNDKLLTLDLLNPCSISDYDFAAVGTTRLESCGCTWASSSQVANYSTLTEERDLYETELINLYDIVKDVPF